MEIEPDLIPVMDAVNEPSLERVALPISADPPSSFVRAKEIRLSTGTPVGFEFP